VGITEAGTELGSLETGQSVMGSAVRGAQEGSVDGISVKLDWGLELGSAVLGLAVGAIVGMLDSRVAVGLAEGVAVGLVVQLRPSRHRLAGPQLAGRGHRRTP
jgi:hypothetical protein